MTQKQVERVVHCEPFRPYKLRLSSGEEIVVRKARKSSVSGDQVALVGECQMNDGSAPVERFRIIKIEKIVSAEQVNRS